MALCIQSCLFPLLCFTGASPPKTSCTLKPISTFAYQRAQLKCSLSPVDLIMIQMHTLDGLALFTLQNCDNITYDSIHFAFVTSLKIVWLWHQVHLGDLTHYFNSCIAFDGIDVPQFPHWLEFLFSIFFFLLFKQCCSKITCRSIYNTFLYTRYFISIGYIFKSRISGARNMEFWNECWLIAFQKALKSINSHQPNSHISTSSRYNHTFFFLVWGL